MEKENSQGFGSLLKKAHFVVNRYTGSLKNALPLSDMTPEGFLPYIPSWKQVDQADLLLCSPVFQREVLKLLRHLLGNTDEQVPAASGGGVFAG